jgi:hypothetical protein
VAWRLRGMRTEGAVRLRGSAPWRRRARRGIESRVAGLGVGSLAHHAHRNRGLGIGLLLARQVVSCIGSTEALLVGSVCTVPLLSP